MDKVNPVSIPSSAKRLRVEVYIRPTQNSGMLSFDFEFDKSLNGHPAVFKTQGFYYDSYYCGSISLYVNTNVVRIAYGGEWTKVYYGGKAYNPEDMNYCTMVVYYR